MEILCYAHGGSYNHGCEAIVRSTHKIIKQIRYHEKIKLYSSKKNEDDEFGISDVCNTIQIGDFKINMNLNNIISGIKYKIFKDKDALYYLQNKELLMNKNAVALSIGGDNYCYNDRKRLYYINNQLKLRKIKTVLWGCSIEPNDMDFEMIDDLKGYDLIAARESITYNALLEKGVNTNTKLYPDPAFQLDRIDLPLPKGFIAGNTIGVNVSPLIIKCESLKGTTLENYSALLKHIIDTTNSQIALIPHVTWKNSNDLEPLTILYEQFEHTGRVVLIGEKYNCMELKGFIARCKIFIGARTHATVAAYSTYVPTLVVGYSVKALGIARDIFGSEENMVIPVQTLQNKDDLIRAFEYVKKNEGILRNYLQKFIPSYAEKSLQAGEELKKIIG